MKSPPIQYSTGWPFAALCTDKEFTHGIKSHQYSLNYSSEQFVLPHHFHDMSTPLGEQLHALQGQVKQLPVLSISLLGLLTPWSGHHLHRHKLTHISNRTLSALPQNADLPTGQVNKKNLLNLVRREKLFSDIKKRWMWWLKLLSHLSLVHQQTWSTTQVS